MFPAVGGEPYTVRGLYSSFRLTVQRAGLEGVSPNTLRHSAASWMIALGSDIYSVQRQLGHSKASVTLDVYGGLMDSSRDRLRERMDAALADAPEATEAQVVAIRQ